MPFVGAIQRLTDEISVWYLRGKNIGKFLQTFAVSLDGGLQELDAGLRLSQPLRCDTSALPVLSQDRGIRLYPTESLQSKRFRLSQWKQLHRTRGCHVGEMRHLQPYFLPDTPIIRIVHQDGRADATKRTATWWTLNADNTVDIVTRTPSNWDYDGLTSQWSRFWVILYVPPSLFTRFRYDDGTTYDGGAFYDWLSVTQQANDWINMILEWQAAHSHLKAFIVATDPASFDPNANAVTAPDLWTSLPVGNWGSPLSPAPGSHATRPPTAFWIYEQ